jgi:hypothetical protein
MRGEIIHPYHKLTAEDQKAVRRWICIKMVIATILLAGLIALAVNAPGDKPETSDQHATIQHKLLSPESASTSPSR